jgi:hypothetical protein
LFSIFLSLKIFYISDKVYQLLAHGRWFSPGFPASSTTKTGRHDIAEILLKVALKHQKSNQLDIKGIFTASYTQYIIDKHHIKPRKQNIHNVHLQSQVSC